MQNRDNNPYDDIFANISKIVEEIVRNMPEHQNARIIGYTIVTRGAGGQPYVFRVGEENNDDDDAIPVEMTESDDTIYITAEIPPDPKHAPYADIQVDAVRICVDDYETTVPLEHPVDVIHSHYRVHRGIMDITLRKIRHR